MEQVRLKKTGSYDVSVYFRSLWLDYCDVTFFIPVVTYEPDPSLYTKCDRLALDAFFDEPFVFDIVEALVFSDFSCS